MMRGDENGVFSTLLKCSNYTCNQGIAVLGDYSSDIIDASYNTETSYTIRDVYPPIALINIPAGATEPIKRALQRSFGLYWRDPQSCATTLRTAIEGIADAVGHPARQNGRFVNLGTRLKRMKATHPELVGAAEAIKDVGNVGAQGDAVDQTGISQRAKNVRRAVAPAPPCGPKAAPWQGGGEACGGLSGVWP
jgi:hypothetical protein